MSQLHVHFHLRNQQAFQRLLDGKPPSSQQQSSTLSSSLTGGAGGGGHSPGGGGGGKSWGKRQSSMKDAMAASEVNARDHLGRTVLHLACSATDQSAPEYVRLLLAHPGINVNLLDGESHWTALHRALYNGNIAAAILLLQRSDTDTSLKDHEGYTAFDLYNSTVEGTKPTPSSFDTSASNGDGIVADLFTWGANRNAALGLGDGDDRVYPDQVVIRRDPTVAASVEKNSVEKMLTPIRVKQVVMSKLHTVIVTDEERGNLRVCGFGSGGRLGPGQHTQYTFTTLPNLTSTITSVALGQDHTLAVTSTGEVLSWGLNRFSQLGYVIESSSPFPGVVVGGGGLGLGGAEQVQSTPRKVFGLLKKEVVKGVAACRSASACWTDGEVFTWGSNSGQLGYDKAAQPVQVLPRKVPKLTNPVEAISLSDTAMACLLVTQEVVCIWNDRHFKINFANQAFPPEIRYRPPQNNASIVKITCCDNTFAALSGNGELFTFNVPNPSETEASSGAGGKGMAIKPQRVWSLRKQWSAVKDVALGSDGSIIICTESGHVFVRSRNPKSTATNTAKTWKFQRIPYIQRVIRVTANTTGAFGVLRLDYVPRKVEVVGGLLAGDLAGIQPYLRVPDGVGVGGGVDVKRVVQVVGSPIVGEESFGSPDPDEEAEDLSIQRDIKQVLRLCEILTLDKETRKGGEKKGLFDGVKLAYGADLMVQVQSGSEIPVHRLVLAARSPVLCDILAGKKVVQDRSMNVSIKFHQRKNVSSGGVLAITGCHPLSVLLLLVYLYSDELLAVWDRRVGLAVQHQLDSIKVNPGQIKVELQALARVLDLPALVSALEAPAKRIPIPTITRDFGRLFYDSQDGRGSGKGKETMRSPVSPDVVIELQDKEVFCHSAILRARSSLFAAFFDDEDWTVNRWTVDGIVVVNLRHLKWRVMEFVMRFLCCGGDVDLFDDLDFVQSVDQLLDFIFEVMAAASELLLDRLLLICSAVVLRHVNVHNACFTLADATHYNAYDLIRSVQGYLAVNMETFLESRMLEDLSPELIKQLSAFIRSKQAEKSPISRTNRLVDAAVERNAEWLSMQDIPHPIPRSKAGALRDSAKLSPPGSAKKSRRLSATGSPIISPTIRAMRSFRVDPLVPHEDDLFAMDDTESVPPLDLAQAHSPTTDLPVKSAPVWKPLTSGPRTDMKAIMAEAERSKVPTSTPLPSGSRPLPSGNAEGGQTPPAKWAAKTPQRDERSYPNPPRSPAGSTWRVPVTTPAAPSSPVNLKAIRSSPAATPISTPPSGISRLREEMKSRQPPPVPSSPKVLPRQSPQAPRGREVASGSTLGPVYAPSRQLSSKDVTSMRRVPSGGTVWTAPPVHPVVEPVLQGSAPSFVAIQQMQLDQVAGSSKGKHQSLREIQEEENARRAEEDFLKWWAAEEERVRLETEGPPPPSSDTSHRPKPRPKKAKGPKAPARDAQQTSTAPSSQPPTDGSRRKNRPPRRSGPSQTPVQQQPPSQ
ncbi:hypothetical protein JAAARDRAFT_528626 [Jaapia argillacea MUCL 33604]|uniref:BTB domain-containing protein n=1 Tax=Jaapia argillacea MUCL 33604 TaxID=933084 RepID=A0A067QHC2_9AGAM|nr:hypothetical protein JAAARDRAFT_528626 [Jaapia argillacea MUCL 33604]